jgi:hypothetical protein
MSSGISRILLSLKNLWAYQHRKALVTFRVVQDSPLALIVASNFKPNWDLVQRQVSGLLETACKILVHVDAVKSVTLRSSDNVHVAIKILTGYATRLNREHKLRELEVLQCLSSVAPDDHCARLLAQFVHPGIDDDEEHLCLVTGLLSSSVEDTLEALHGGFIPVPVVKRMLRHVLLGVARLHKYGIVHTGMFTS